jgi:hypothetical protein
VIIKIEVLRQILNHLLNSPGEFEWWRYCTIRDVDVLETAIHRQWLQANGFISIEEGRSYRTDRSVKDLAELLGLQPIAANPVRPKVSTPRSAKPAPRKPRTPRPKRVDPVVVDSCFRDISSLEFTRLTLPDIRHLLKTNCRSSYTIEAIDRTLKRMTPVPDSGVTVLRFRHENFVRYSRQKQQQAIKGGY